MARDSDRTEAGRIEAESRTDRRRSGSGLERVGLREHPVRVPGGDLDHRAWPARTLEVVMVPTSMAGDAGDPDNLTSLLACARSNCHAGLRRPAMSGTVAGDCDA
jgi:hypothetical protein